MSKKVSKKVDDSFSTHSDHAHHGKVKVFIGDKPTYVNKEDLRNYLYGDCGPVKFASDMVELIVSNASTTIRHNQIDKIVKPYAVLHSLGNISKDMIQSSSYHDKRYDDGHYEEDPTIVDPVIPQKEVWAVYDPNPGQHRNLQKLLERQNRPRDSEDTVEPSSSFKDLEKSYSFSGTA